MSRYLQPFHLALPVSNLADAEEFYCRILGCSKGRTASRWVDLDFFGHQLTLHLVGDEVGEQATMFLHDPSGNALEFKSFADRNQMFAV